MTYCAEHGVPHSVFLGRAVEAGGPVWLATDRAKALAWMLERGSNCSRCGTPRWEWDADALAYEPVEEYCHGCYLLAIAEEEARGGSAGARPGRRIVLVPKAVAAVMRHAPKPKPPRRQRRSG